ncbi:Os05g0214232 [Oryza sativa Japonica Group]|uniref:Os05g0214232 protein n=1 Tax=Oryza sativa subsp. japonica TaxID=39947 RepID=A0A0P0WJK6_ORYSJ|nr:hypothetical protein EE612_027871 [Oryza sativa]KAF2929679.1 hypothetical protein DAI22_05g074100 [Oryza sativa Japonica Group]BAS92822.1 Os05g0214232 [Oryza sativa Japonica Group]
MLRLSDGWSSRAAGVCSSVGFGPCPRCHPRLHPAPPEVAPTGPCVRRARAPKWSRSLLYSHLRCALLTLLSALAWKWMWELGNEWSWARGKAALSFPTR